MPKSRKKSAAKVNAASAVVSPTKSMKKGKRDAEEIDEKNIVSCKKQKAFNEVEEKKEPKPFNKQSVLLAKTVKPDSSSLDESESSDEIGPSDDEEDVKPAEIAAPAEKAAPVAQNGSVAAKIEVSEEEVIAAQAKEPAAAVASKEDAKPADIAASNEKAAPVAKNGSVASMIEESEEVKSASAREPEAAVATKSTDAKMVDAKMVDAQSAKKVSQTPATPQASGSKTLYMGNLSFSIEESDVVNFFKDAGEVVAIRFAMIDDRLAGYGHVEFATPEAAQEALKLNGEELNGRAVKLDLARERGVNERSSKKSGGQGPSLTICVSGFSRDEGFDSLRSALEGHFGQCGEVTRCHIRKDYETNAPKGIAFLEFADSTAFNKALELSGSNVGGGTITVEEAKHSGDRNSGVKVAPVAKNRFVASMMEECEEVKSAPAKEPAAAVATKRTDAEMVGAQSAKKVPQTPSTPQASGSKTVFMGNLSFSIQLSDVVNFFKDEGEVVEVSFAMRDNRFAGYGHVDFATPEAAQEALKLDGEELSGRVVKLDLVKERGGNWRSSKKSTDVEMIDAQSAKKTPQTPATPQASVSKTLFIGNLSFSIDESEVVNFFKDVGEVVDIRFAMRDDRFAGYGYVDFATPEAAQEALKLNGEELNGRAVKLGLATKKQDNERSSKKSGGQGASLSIYVSGFGHNEDFDSLRSTLEGYFGQCGEVTKCDIPKDYETNAPKGIAFLYFADSTAFNKALELSGSNVGGGTITVVANHKPKGDPRRNSGRGRGRGRVGGRGRGRGRVGGRGKENISFSDNQG